MQIAMQTLWMLRRSTALQRRRLKLYVRESVHGSLHFIISNTRSTLILIDTQKVW